MRLIFFLFLLGGTAISVPTTAQQPVTDIPELCRYIDQQFVLPESDLLYGLLTGVQRVCDYRNTQTGALKQKLAAETGLPGGKVLALMADSIFVYYKNRLLPAAYDSVFRQFENGFRLFGERFCRCVEKLPVAHAEEKMAAIYACSRKTVSDNEVVVAISKDARKFDAEEGEQIDRALKAYSFINCVTLYSHALALAKADIPNETPNTIESLFLEKIHFVLELWKRHSTDSVGAIFPAYTQYAEALNAVVRQNAPGVHYDFEFRQYKNENRTDVEYTYSRGRGKKLVILNRAVFRFQSYSASAQLLSLTIIPFEKIPGGKALLRKWQEDTQAPSGGLSWPPPPPPPPRKKG